MTLIIWVFSLIFGMVATFVLMLHRFYKNLLTDEGYLMFTLPCSVHHLIVVKVVTAAIWMLVSAAVCALCVGVAVVDNEFIFDLMDLIRMALRELHMDMAVNAVAAILELVVILFLSSAGYCLQFYSAMSIGHGFSNHKVLWSVVAFFIQNTVIQIIGTVASATMIVRSTWQNLDLSNVQMWHMAMLGIIAVQVVLCALFYALTAWNLKNRLNLS